MSHVVDELSMWSSLTVFGFIVGYVVVIAVVTTIDLLLATLFSLTVQRL